MFKNAADTKRKESTWQAKGHKHLSFPTIIRVILNIVVGLNRCSLGKIIIYSWRSNTETNSKRENTLHLPTLNWSSIKTTRRLLTNLWCKKVVSRISVPIITSRRVEPKVTTFRIGQKRATKHTRNMSKVLILYLLRTWDPKNNIWSFVSSCLNRPRYISITSKRSTWSRLGNGLLIIRFWERIFANHLILYSGYAMTWFRLGESRKRTPGLCVLRQRHRLTWTINLEAFYTTARRFWNTGILSKWGNKQDRCRKGSIWCEKMPCFNTNREISNSLIELYLLEACTLNLSILQSWDTLALLFSMTSVTLHQLRFTIETRRL